MTGILPMAAIAMQAGSSLFQGFSAQSASERQAKIDEENGRLSLLSGEKDAYNILRTERRQAGDALTDMAGSGFAVGTGSAADVIAASAAQAELEIAGRRQQARGEERNYLASAAANRAAGKASMLGGLFGAVSSVVAGAADIKNQQTLKLQGQWERGMAKTGGRAPPLIAAKQGNPWLTRPNARVWNLNSTGGQ